MATHARVNPIRANQNISLNALAVVKVRDHAIAMIGELFETVSKVEPLGRQAAYQGV
jgi:hypothetical protein